MEDMDIQGMFDNQTSDKKNQRERNKKEFFDRIKDFRYVDNAENSRNIQKGDEVIVLNGYDIPVGPFEVLGFRCEAGEVRLWLDWDCYWVSKSIDKVIAVRPSKES